MISTLTKQSVQDWGLLGLRPMHRALVRRYVVQKTLNPLAMPVQQSVVWHLASWHSKAYCGGPAYLDQGQSDCENLLLSSLHRTGVLVVERAGLLQRVKEDRQDDLLLAELHRSSHRSSQDRSHGRSYRQIRLLWNWSLRGMQDLAWCTELSFDGVIHDAGSLMKWVRVCLAQGKAYECQQNSLLRDLHMPELVAPTTISR